ncbi:unnamed protein product [Rhizophagus irregularis]|nr:unnamed protein product [Rhizophagus irregularis]
MSIVELRKNGANVFQGRPIQKSEAEKEAHRPEVEQLEERKSGRAEQKVLFSRNNRRNRVIIQSGTSHKTGRKITWYEPQRNQDAEKDGLAESESKDGSPIVSRLRRVEIFYVVKNFSCYAQISFFKYFHNLLFFYNFNKR